MLWILLWLRRYEKRYNETPYYARKPGRTPLEMLGIVFAVFLLLFFIVFIGVAVTVNGIKHNNLAGRGASGNRSFSPPSLMPAAHAAINRRPMPPPAPAPAWQNPTGSVAARNSGANGPEVASAAPARARFQPPAPAFVPPSSGDTPIAAPPLKSTAFAPPPPPDAGDAVPTLAATPAVPAVPIPDNPTPDSVADAAARLAIPDWSTRYHSVAWLSDRKPTAADRTRVVPALLALLDDDQEVVRTGAAICLRNWADSSSTAAIAAKLPTSAGETRTTLLALAGQIKTPALADAVATLMADAKGRPAARRTLMDMGPVAEKAAVGLLKSEDPAVRHDACFILQSVGTKASLTELRPLTRVLEKDPAVKSAAGLAIDAINARGK